MTSEPSGGNTGRAPVLPAITANATPSRITSTAAAVAARASAILVRGLPIDPEQSMMMISAPATSSAATGTLSPDVTVMTALTSWPPAGRNSFW